MFDIPDDGNLGVSDGTEPGTYPGGDGGGGAGCKLKPDTAALQAGGEQLYRTQDKRIPVRTAMGVDGVRTAAPLAKAEDKEPNWLLARMGRKFTR